MPAKKLSRTDFESRFFDLLENKIDGMDKRIDSLTTETHALKNELQALRNQTKDPIPSWYSDKKLLYIALTCVLVFLLIAAAVLGVKVPAL